MSDPSRKPVVSPLPFVAGLRLPMVLILWGLPAGWAIAAESNPAPPEPSTQESAMEDLVHRIHELGYFHLRQLRPTRDETINVKFELHLLMPEDAPGPELEKRLNRWTQRLRDQVITAVRKAEIKDFTEPGLRRLQKMILLRINRLLKFSRIEGVYLTRYEFVLL